MKVVQIFDTRQEADGAFDNFCKYNQNYFVINRFCRKATNNSIMFEFIWCKESDNNPLGCVQAEVLQYFGKSEIISNMVASRIGRFNSRHIKIPKSMRKMINEFINRFEK